MHRLGLLPRLIALAMLLQSCLAAKPTFGVEHSLDGGQTWQAKGEVSIKVTGGVSEVRFQPSFAAWQGDQLDSLVHLANHGGLYLLRMPRTIPTEGPQETDYAMISVAPCLLFNTHFKEQYNFYPTLVGGAITGLVGLQNVATKLRGGSRDFCSALAAPLPGTDPAITVESLPTPAKHTVVYGLSLPARSPLVPDDVYVGARAERAPGQADGHGPGHQPQEEKSFFQKYWVVILMCVTVMMMTGGAGNVQQEAGRQGEEGQQGTAVAGSALPRPAASKKSN